MGKRSCRVFPNEKPLPIDGSQKGQRFFLKMALRAGGRRSPRCRLDASVVIAGIWLDAAIDLASRKECVSRLETRSRAIPAPKVPHPQGLLQELPATRARPSFAANLRRGRRRPKPGRTQRPGQHRLSQQALRHVLRQDRRSPQRGQRHRHQVGHPLRGAHNLEESPVGRAKVFPRQVIDLMQEALRLRDAYRAGQRTQENLVAV